MAADIEFGTDGWRAIIADQFTFQNVRLVADAIAATVQELELPDGIDRQTMIVGYDRRFLSRDFAYEAALTLSKSGIHVLLSDHDLPSQSVSWAVHERKLAGGVVITASHNPAGYNGIKFKGWYGGSGLPEIYRGISANLGRSIRGGGGSISEVDILTGYVAAVAARIGVDRIVGSGLRILHDPMHGVAAGLPARILGFDDESRKGMTLRTIRGEINPGFGGVNPEPIEENLHLTQRVVRRDGYDLAICNDGDADRLGVLDERGEFVSPQQILSLLALYLIRHRGLRGDLVKTFSTTRLIEKIAAKLDVPLHETPIGFKYVADIMLEREVLIGGEESGGIGFGSFIPERDGILSGLLVAECMAESGKPLSQLIDEMAQEFGRLHYARRDERRSREACESLITRASSGELDARLPLEVTSRETVDGVKLNFADGSWLLLRKSGTEPMIRIYSEGPDRNSVERLLAAATAAL